MKVCIREKNSWKYKKVINEIIFYFKAIIFSIKKVFDNKKYAVVKIKEENYSGSGPGSYCLEVKR